jgi:cytosine/adenosine deaminase-related metal-dependent hydrolase
MIRGGIVAVGDICNNSLTIAQKQQQRLAYYNFIEVSGWLPDIAEARFSKAEEVRKAFEESKHSKNKDVLVPHAPYSVSERLWQLLAPSFPGKTVTIHNQETAFEDELFISGKGGFSRMYELMKLDNSFFRPAGKSSLQSFFSRADAAARLMLVHNTFTKEEDIVFVQNTSRPVSWCLCANANLYIENALPPVELLRKHDCSLVIGTDSLASNHSLSVLDELKTLHTYFPDIPLQELLSWATLNGAIALQMDDTLGSFENGKTPGINLLQEVPGERITSHTTISRLL